MWIFLNQSSDDILFACPFILAKLNILSRSSLLHILTDQEKQTNKHKSVYLQ